MKLLSDKIKNTKNLILDILFLLSGISILLFYKNMFYLHIIVISLMIFMLIKCYYQGIKNGVMWLSLIILPFVISLFKDSFLTKNELSEILLILAPSITVGVLGDKQRRYIKQLKETYLSALKALAQTTDARDSYTQGHSERVARYAVLIAKELSLPENKISFLEQAALLHDIGKIAVPDTVLHKTGSLNEEEWLIMKKHPEYSQRIISRLDFLSPILPIVLYHHRRFDEREHPFEENLVNVRLIAGILAVADAFDAMTSDRPYRDRLSLGQAFEELEKYSGTQFDPEVVKALKRVKDLQMRGQDEKTF